MQRPGQVISSHHKVLASSGGTRRIVGGFETAIDGLHGLVTPVAVKPPYCDLAQA